MRQCFRPFGLIVPYLPSLCGNIAQNSDSNHILKSDLDQVNIGGQIPSEITLLPNLEILSITSALVVAQDRSTAMKAIIPENIGWLQQLRVLRLTLLDVMGTIPSSFRNLSRLTDLTLSSASPFEGLSISGYVPGLPTSLERLIITRSKLAGFDDTAIGRLSNLRLLRLIDNPAFQAPTEKFAGAYLEAVTIQRCPMISGFFFGASTLKILQITSDHIHIDLKAEFWSLNTQLERIEVQSDFVQGSFLPNIANITTLQYIYIRSVQFGGIIPKEISSLSELLHFELVHTHLTGPLPNFDGCRKLAKLVIANAKDLGYLPDGLERLPNLTTLIIQSSGLIGTIPRAHINKQGSNFEKYDLSDNNLNGNIPEIACLDCNLKRNRLTGTIPRSIGRNATKIDLSFNQLGPFIDSDIFTNGRQKAATSIDISNNEFDSPLPELYEDSRTASDSLSVTFSVNKFHGIVPDSWYPYGSIDLSYNRLSGDLKPLLSSFRGKYLRLSANQFNGTIPPITAKFQQLLLDYNYFTGAPPPVPRTLLYFNAEVNQLNGTITDEFIDSVIAGSLQSLFLNANLLQCSDSNAHVLGDLLNSTLKVLFLQSNNFSCFFSRQDIPILLGKAFSSQATALDLSFNLLTGTFNPADFPFLSTLIISNNRFYGEAPLKPAIFPTIAHVDISFNKFSTDVSEITGLAFLYSLKASRNRLRGSLGSGNLPNLETLDLRYNGLNEPLNLAGIGFQFTRQSLKVLSIEFNFDLPSIRSFDTNTTALDRSQTSSPSSKFSTTVVCYSLTFQKKEGITFTFDENIFSYLQCDCNAKHFGLPPTNCHQCPSVIDAHTGTLSGVEHCGAKSLNVSRNSFVLIPTQFERVQADENSVASSRLSQGVNVLQFESESCLVLPEQILMQESNCLGVTLTGEDTRNLSHLRSALSKQCADGSSGRLCSRCDCDWDSEDPLCYYERALRCVKCSRVFRLSQSLALGTGLLILLIIIGSIGILIALRSKRVQKTVPWLRVSLLKRAFYRFNYLISLGNVSILITFAQIFIELTHWDAYALGRALKLVNLNGETLGLKCMFPFLSNPVYGLLVKLLLPFGALLLIVTCTGLAELTSKLLTRIGAWRSGSLVGSVDHDDSSDTSPIITGDLQDAHSEHAWEANASLLGSSRPLPQTLNGTWISLSKDMLHGQLGVNYPTTALLSTICISMIRFVYFNTALSAHEFLFSTRDQHTHVSYVQNLPFLKTSDATLERWLSVPIVIIFDLLLPIGFLILCFNLRNKIQSPRTKMYFGSLFDAFDPKCYWWEAVTTFKKLSIALVLRAIPASNVLQVTLIVSILTGIQIIQLTLQPWRRKIENAAEAVGTSILIGALLSARSGRYRNSMVSVYYVIAAAAIYAFASICLILYQTWTGTTEYQKALSRLQEAARSKSGLQSDFSDQENQENLSSLHTIQSHTRRKENEYDALSATDFEPSDHEIN